MFFRNLIGRLSRYPKKTDNNYHELFVCPDCLEKGYISDNFYICSQCKKQFKIVDGVPIFINLPEEYIDQRGNTTPTNPYPQKVIDLAVNNPNARILDFGAGCPRKEHMFSNILRLDYIHYYNTHVVSTNRNLPFKSESFDHIVSLSVFEHVRDPWHYAEECYRVLKPGGTIIIDTAFLQPEHSTPFHYFNMTLEGLKETFKMFKIIDLGVEPYQSAGTTMNILSDTFISIIGDTQKKAELEKILKQCDFANYDKYISTNEKSKMAAGVCLIGLKEKKSGIL
jgi:SAM-dependent methyltransferase